MGPQSSAYDISRDIWERKYRYAGGEKIPADKSVEATMSRVAKACAANEKQRSRKSWEKKFYSILEDFKFIPGGRILANAGTERREVTMFNCYVMNSIPDSIDGIFDTVKESALTQKHGGGVGFDFSSLRPAGAPIRGCEAFSSGPVSFMKVLDATCRTIMSAGQRRGAQMAVMRCDHPDIEAFITAKRNNASLQMFNLSVAVTDEFIKAVKDNKDWKLIFKGKVYKTIHAAELWDLIMRSTYDFAEPGFILIDEINRMNNLYYTETISATNPCGEQPLPPYGACLLGSLNLTRFVKNAFTPGASLDFGGIGETTAAAVRLLDNVIDFSNYPLPQQREEAISKRRMGVGITGLADTLIMLGVKYGTPESLKIAEDIMRAITLTAYETSVETGKEKGAFPLFDAKKYCAGAFVSKLPAELRGKILRGGIRNSHLTSVAPTGTISLLAGNISSGLEPVFALKYFRKIRNGNEKDVTEVEVMDFAYKEYLAHLKRKNTEAPAALPDYFVTADKISPDGHLNMQAALQKHVDSSISKTINVPADYPFEDFAGIYMKACGKGLKGCTTFRPSDHITGILRKEDDKAAKKAAEAAPGTDHPPKTITKRPRELEGTTYKIKTPLSADALYVTINDLIDDNGKRRPYELFINTKNLQHFSWIVAMTRLISAVFRHDPEPLFLVDELKSVYDPNGGYFSDGAYIPSLAADIGRVIDKHLKKIGIKKDEKAQKPHAAAPEKNAAPPPPEPPQSVTEKTTAGGALMICPQCNERALLSQENCLKCLSCGYSKCG